jgi:hypothetical protein
VGLGHQEAGIQKTPTKQSRTKQNKTINTQTKEGRREAFVVKDFDIDCFKKKH